MANGKGKKGNERGHIYLPPEAWQELRVEAARRKMSMGEVVLEALRSRVTVTYSPEPKK